MSDATESKKSSPVKDKPTPKVSLWCRWFVKLAVVVVTLLVLVVGYMFLSSPAAIRSPKLEHAHFRWQLVVEGDVVNFGDAKFQSEKPGVASCNVDLPASPIHFHDLKDQYVHLHWKGMTGGLILKNYGWNMIGGPSGKLGYRFDDLPKIHSVPIYGDVLPKMPEGAKLWVYTGDEQSYKERSSNDFLHQDVETFFNKRSTVTGEEQTSWLDKLIFAKASAHGGEVHDDSTTPDLELINNVLGNVVVFAQKAKPTDQQVKDRFNHLEPLTDSVCGG